MVVILFVSCLMLGSFQASSLMMETENDSLTQKYSIPISTPELMQKDSFSKITVEEQTSLIRRTGEPMLPKITKTFALPFGSRIDQVDVSFSSPVRMNVPQLVQPASPPVIDGRIPSVKPVCSKEIYTANVLYPTTTYSVQTSVGVEDGEHVVFISVHCYPIRYHPVDNRIMYSDQVDISVEYTLPETEMSFPDEYDLLVIAPQLFSDELQPLLDHKNEMGMRTYLKTLEMIYDEFDDQGRDAQEQIKYCIKADIEEYGIDYVLLVGGIKGQSQQWYLPVRYGHSPSEDAYVSDLYYADVYKLVDDEIVFDDWDSNNNGKFAEFSIFSKDDIDGSPDVSIGRLACRNEQEVVTVVEKLINYEQTKAAESWFKNMLLIGGDTYPYDGAYTGCEAEIDTNLSASYMDGFRFTRLWASTGALTGQEVVEDAINDGAGLVHMAGHANPASLVTHPPFDKSTSIIILQMYNFYDLSHVNPKLTNEDKLPVIVVGGCHNSQFNVSLSNIFEDIKEYGLKKYVMNRFFYMEWVPECWSWWLTSKPDGGAIVTMGNTGLGMGIGGEDYVTGLDGWLFPRFFYHYGQNNIHNVGLAHSNAITDYVNEFDINRSGEDRQMVQQWVLLGDPSLLVGGYET